ncbi:DUF2142 domain-containing protein [Microbacterium sp. RU33B]|uniref:DUF2142 domain-containing protein n=1 Tax=Microbacterium sp. RU33B TaxID=1907390 RepID=UPI0021168C57|nr:DUF2142 domain-containing protein [Microbacterium sp. RU33B]
MTLVSWAFASPVGSSPDDNFHLPSIWCGLGDREGLCEPSGDDSTRLVPTPVTTAPCYAFQPNESAACWISDESGLSEATWMNAVGLYPPLFYTTMSVFVGPDVTTSVITMRIFNSTLIVGILSTVFFVLPTRLRPALVISILATSVPLGLFVFASTNPSSWAMLAAAIIWVSLYGATQTTGRRQVALGSLAVLGAVLGAGSRADSSIYAVFAVVLAAVLGVRRGHARSLLVPGIAAAVIVAVCAGFYLSSGQSASLAAGLPTDNPPLTGGQQLANLFGVPVLWYGAFGASGLGWLDTVPPAAVTNLAFAVFAATIFIGIHRLTARRALAVAAAFGALWLVPFVLLAQSRAVVGTEVQSRYLLPLIIILVGVASLTPQASAAWQGPRSLVAGTALAVAMSLALHANIRRYTVGADSNAIDPGAGAEWWWVTGPSPMGIWIIGTVCFAGIFALLYVVLRNGVVEPGIDSEELTR